jgi:hypothetical protein
MVPVVQNTDICGFATKYMQITIQKPLKKHRSSKHYEITKKKSSIYNKQKLLAHTCNPSTQEAEEERWSSIQLRLHSEKNNKKLQKVMIVS